MNKRAQIRNVLKGLRRRLKGEAAKQPTVAEIFDSIRRQGPVKPKISVAEMVRMERERT